MTEQSIKPENIKAYRRIIGGYWLYSNTFAWIHISKYLYEEESIYYAPHNREDWT